VKKLECKSIVQFKIKSWFITEIQKQVLCVSGASANKFSAILFLLFAQSNSPQSFQCFRQILGAKFNLNSTTGEEFSHKPPLSKSPAFGNIKTLRKAGNFYNGGLWGKSLPVVRFK